MDNSTRNVLLMFIFFSKFEPLTIHRLFTRKDTDNEF